MQLYGVSLYDLMQWSIVGAVVVVSALYMLGRLAPQWRAQFAMHLQQARYARWINQLGMRIGGGASCGSCNSCGSCTTPSTVNKK